MDFSGPVRLVLVEDNDVFREALELLLGLRSDIDIVGAARDGVEALELCGREQPDVVLLDYRLPALDGVQAARALGDACPETAVVCLTASASPRETEALLEAGAVECLTKDRKLDEIVATIQRAGRAARARQERVHALDD
jgi:DNA-binding NarL/FixJ family response regulator